VVCPAKVSPTVRIAAAVLAIGLVGYAGWLLVGPEPSEPAAAEPKSSKTPRRGKAASADDGAPATARAREPRVRREPGAGSPDAPDAAVNMAVDIPPETARVQLKVLVEDIEAKAERGGTMSQPEWVAMYKRGSELAQSMAKGADPDDAAKQKEFGELNTRFRIAIGKVQPRSP
jgi:hypothetical protein